MGDFNARVGVRTELQVDDPEDARGAEVHVLGDYGMEELNDNGRLLLDFCREGISKAMRIMSTKYRHKTYGTWQHNRTKLWHQVDHVLSKARTSPLFTDVRCMPGLDFDSDHRLVRVSLRVMKVGKQPQGKQGGLKQVVDQRLPQLRVDRLREESTVNQLNERFSELVEEVLVDEYETWARGLRSISEQVLGTDMPVHRPAWQRDNAAELEELSAKRQAAYRRKHESAEAARAYKQICRTNRKHVTRILNKWWADKASAVQEAVDRKEANHQYKGLLELRRVFDNGRKSACKIKSREGRVYCYALDRNVLIDGENILRNY